MTTPTETPPTDSTRDAFRVVIAFLQLLTMPRSLVSLTGIPEIVERAARYFVRDSYTLNPAVTELRGLVERAAEDHARRTEPQNASLEESDAQRAEIERLRSLLSEARRRLAPLPRALTPEDHEPDTLPARIDAALGGKDH